MTSCEVTIVNPLGLHARAAARFVHAASAFSARIRVARGSVAVSAAPAPRAAPAAVPQPITESVSMPIDAAKHPGVVKSPMVGTAYQAPEPGARHYIEVGA